MRKRTYRLRKPPVEMIGRNVGKFWGRWQLDGSNWQRQPDGRYELTLTWRRELSRYLTSINLGTGEITRKSMYGTIPMRDRLHLLWLSVASMFCGRGEVKPEASE